MAETKLTKRLTNALRRFVQVQRCAGCGTILSQEDFDRAFCSTCRRSWNAAKVENCPRCYRPAIECTCMPKGLSRAGALCLRKIVFYMPSRSGEPSNRIVYRIKKRPIKRYFRFLASELESELRREIELLGCVPEDVLVLGVPRGRRGKAENGFDQAELLAREIGKALGVSYGTAIRRKPGGSVQKKLNREERFRNTEHSFYIKDGASLRGKLILLTDDVVTTGASMAGCVKLLRKAGVGCVLCVCVAQDQKKSKI